MLNNEFAINYLAELGLSEKYIEVLVKRLEFYNYNGNDGRGKRFVGAVDTAIKSDVDLVVLGLVNQDLMYELWGEETWNLVLSAERNNLLLETGYGSDEMNGGDEIGWKKMKLERIEKMLGITQIESNR